MADFGTKLLEMLTPNIAAANGEVPATDPVAAPADQPAADQAELAELERQLAMLQSQQLTQNYITDLRANPSMPQPAGLLAGFDKQQAGAAHDAMLYGRPSPNNYTGPTIMDLQRLERAQQEAQAQLYAASRP